MKLYYDDNYPTSPIRLIPKKMEFSKKPFRHFPLHRNCHLGKIPCMAKPPFLRITIVLSGLFLSTALLLADPIIPWVVVDIEGDGSFYTQEAGLTVGHFHGTLTYPGNPVENFGGFMPLFQGKVDGSGFQITGFGPYWLFDTRANPLTGEFQSFGGVGWGVRSDFQPVGYEYQNHFTLQFDSTGQGSFDWVATYLDVPTNVITDSADAHGTFGLVPDSGSTALLLGLSVLGVCVASTIYPRSPITI